VNLRQALENARRTLLDNNIEEPSLEGEILLRHVLGISRACLFSQLEKQLDSKQEKTLNQALKRRLEGEPTAYITGHREFYGLDFMVDRRVLIPRPETELLVEKSIARAKKHNIHKIADIGTGSGAIAVSLAVNLPGVTIYALDISSEALEVAAANCKNHKVADKVILIRGDMLEALPEPVDLIIANLPYVKTSDLKAQKALAYEPMRALNGGENGMDIIRVFCSHVGEKLNTKGCVLMEIGQGQAKSVAGLLKKAFPEAFVEIFRDLAGIERMMSLSLT